MFTLNTFSERKLSQHSYMYKQTRAFTNDLSIFQFNVFYCGGIYDQLGYLLK